MNNGLADRPTSIAGFLALDNRPAVIAHRGFSGTRPENTLAAVKAAIEVGADMVEVDVTLTADGQVVCIHDETVDRTTNGSGPVTSYDLEELQRLDAGSWFSSQWAGETIPTMAEVLEVAKGRVLVNIEIKSEVVTLEAEGGIAEKVVRLINEMKMSDQVIVSSFEPLALQHVRAIDPSIVTASLFNKDIHRGWAPSDVVNPVDSRALNISQKRVTPALMDQCRTSEIPVGVYTVNKKRNMRKMIRLGVQAIFTNHPDQLLEIIREDPRHQPSSG